MSEIKIIGGRRLDGEIKIQGSKNSSLPILAATVLIEGKSVIHNCPMLSDVDAALSILNHLGCKTKREGSTVTVDASGICRSDIPHKMMREMRSSIVFLGPMLSRTGRAELSSPGGCDIGLRPIDLHLSALRQMGAAVTEDSGQLIFENGKALSGKKISLSFPSVGATENIMLAAVLAKGVTTVVNAAREPEIEDLAMFLNSCGAKISGAGESEITIEGVKKLTSAEHTVISDRIVAATYIAAASATGGRLLLKSAEQRHLNAVCNVFSELGCEFEVGKDSLLVTAPRRPGRTGIIRTMPYPGFPTDAQATAMAAMSLGSGTTVIVENIFENRFKHVCELARLGADIKVEGRVAIIEGVKELRGAPVEATDLRGGGALVVAGLAAQGTTTIGGLSHIDRGYEFIEENLRSAGAEIYRI